MSVKRIVVKVGSSTLTHENGSPNLKYIDELTRILSDIHNMGIDVVLVTSGAVSVGMSKLGMKSRPPELSVKQAVAAVGQCSLMFIYDKLFAEYGTTIAQMLLTRDDVDDSRRKELVINTFSKLLDMNVIPIVNENDTVAVEEIEELKNFGDNDTLSAVVATLVNADILINFSDRDGLYTSNPAENPDAELIELVNEDEINDGLFALAGGAGSQRGTGGMRTKIIAAQIAVKAGIDLIITNGSRPQSLYDIIEGKHIGTLFKSNANKITEV